LTAQEEDYARFAAAFAPARESLEAGRSRSGSTRSLDRRRDADLVGPGVDEA
jgi:hypothetical protein